MGFLWVPYGFSMGSLWASHAYERDGCDKTNVWILFWVSYECDGCDECDVLVFYDWFPMSVTSVMCVACVARLVAC